jgi:hypothetical protein
VSAAAANNVPSAASYPVLPPPVTVHGVVVGPDGKLVPADVTLVSDEIDALDSPGGANDLRFVDTFVAPDATFVRTLPPGKYKAIVTPRDQTPPESLDAARKYAKSIIDLVVDLPAKPNTPLVAQKTLALASTISLGGTCRTADGRPLASAEIEVHASSSLRYALTVADRDPRRWPRTATTTTGPNGEFTLGVDPNATYDVVVRPATGTRFPWVVRRNVSTALTSDITISVPAPTVIDLTLHDPGDNPVPHALVQAFVGVASPTPKKPPVAVEIGRTRTDELGRFQLYLDGTPED